MTCYIFLVFISFFAVAQSQVTFSGKCNNVTTQSNFDINKYLGYWYEIEKFPTIFQNGGSCITVNYKPLKNGSIEIQNNMVLFNQTITLRGTLTETNQTAKDGKLKQNFPALHTYNNEYWVVATDYTNYSIVWNCIQHNNTNDQYAYVLSRNQNLTAEQHRQIYKILQNVTLDTDRFIRVNQTHCTYKGYKKNSASFPQSTLFIFVLIFLKQLF